MKQYNKIKTDFIWKNPVIDTLKHGLDKVFKDIFITSNADERATFMDAVNDIAKSVDGDILKELFEVK